MIAVLAWALVSSLVLFVGYNLFVLRSPVSKVVRELTSVVSSPVRNTTTSACRLTIVDVPGASWLHTQLNPGLIVRHGDGSWDHVVHKIDQEQRLCMAYRQCKFGIPTWNRTWLCDVSLGDLRAQRPRMISADSRLEDPRLFSYDGELHVAVSMVSMGATMAKQIVIPLRSKKVIRSPLNSYVSEMHIEKNWQFFEYRRKKYVVYMVQPLRIFELTGDDLRPVAKVAEQDWTAPDKAQLRGGAPPVFLSDRFYMVVHSKDYKIYILTFDRSFNMIGCTNRPLLTLPGHYIYFPCGLVYDERADAFLVSTGINNKQIGILTLQKSYVDNLLERVF